MRASSARTFASCALRLVLAFAGSMVAAIVRADAFTKSRLLIFMLILLVVERSPWPRLAGPSGASLPACLRSEQDLRAGGRVYKQVSASCCYGCRRPLRANDPNSVLPGP